MTSVHQLREFVTDRLTAAAEEIFREFEKTIAEYQDEIERQRRLLDVVWKPEVKLRRIELQQQDVSKEKQVLSDQQLRNQENNHSLDQEEPEPPQIKTEEDKVCSSQEEEQLVLKQETDTFMLIPPYKESGHNKPEPNSDHQLVSHSFAESEPNTRHINTSHSTNIRDSPMSKTRTDHTSFKWDSSYPRLHAGERPYSCNTRDTPALNNHVKLHTGAKSFSCGKGLVHSCNLRVHMGTHTDKKPFPCNTCGKRFINLSKLKRHLLTHTGEKPHICSTCGRRFNDRSCMKRHMSVHTGEKPYLCKLCGKAFKRNSHLTTHMRIHQKSCVSRGMSTLKTI